MKSVSYALLWVIAAMISGCAVGPDFTPPKPDIPNEWKNKEQNSSLETLSKWWEKLDDPVLNALVEKGLNQNKEIAIAATHNEIFMAQLGIVKSNFLPQISANGSVSRQKLSSTTSNRSSSFNDHTTSYGLNMAMSQFEIDFWGKFARAEESAKASLLASEYNHQLIHSSIAANIVMSYNSLIAQHKLLENGHNNVFLAEQIASIAQAKWDQGVGSYQDVLQARAAVDEARSIIPPIEAKISALENALSVLIGEFPKEFEIEKNHTVVSSIEVPAALPSTLLKRRPDILAAESSWHAANASIGVAKAEYFPSFSLTGLFGFQSADLSKLIQAPSSIWQIAPAVTLPIFSAGRVENQVNVAKAQTKEAQAHYEQTLLIAFSEVENSLKERRTLLEEARALASAQKHYSQAETLSKAEYDNGKTGFLPLLIIRQSRLSNENKIVLNEEATRQNFVTLCKALGGGWE